MTVTYRDAGPDDGLALSTLGAGTFVETFGHLYRPEDLNAFLENHSVINWREQLAGSDYRVRLAEADNDAIGYAKLGSLSLPVEPVRPALQLHQLYVLQEWHGKGVARELMDWVIEAARDEGAVELFLNVFIENARARRFYDRYGFVYVGRYEFMVGTKADEELILRLDLEEGR